MDDQHYIELLLKEADGDLSAAEKDQLAKWLSSSAEHLERAQKIRQMCQMTDRYGTDVEIDVDAAYAKVSRRMKPQTRRLVPARWIFLAAASVVLLLGVFWIRSEQQQPVPDVFSFEGPLNATTLADGSTIYLEEDAYLSFAQTSNRRLVQLKGAAYFEVTPDARSPFVIATTLGTVEVLGTSFEVRARPDEPLYVALTDGSVSVTNREGDQSEVLNPLQSASISMVGHLQIDSTLHPIASWRLAERSFFQTPLKELFTEIETAYQVELQPQNPALLDCVITFTLTYPTMDVLINSLETLLPITFDRQATGQYLIKGSGCE